MNNIDVFNNLNEVATHLRSKFTSEKKTAILIFAHNGIGKTQLSMAFKELGKVDDNTRDTLYFNAFTEDLFFWDNDLENDEILTLKINTASKFFSGLEELEMDNRIRPLLSRYADFDFKIDYKNGAVTFSREIRAEGVTPQLFTNIKISRGEENIFIWCFFLAIAQLVIDQAEAYKWVKYLYVDDPVSSLDDNNVIAIACHLAQLIEDKDTKKVKFDIIISSHHALFFNVMFNETRKGRRFSYFLNRNENFSKYLLKDIKDTPSFHHVVMLKQLQDALDSGKVYGYHFNVLRTVLEKTATFHGFDDFSNCILKDDVNDPDGIIYERILNLLSHGKYSLFDIKILEDDNKKYLSDIIGELRKNYRFNPVLFETTKNTELTKIQSNQLGNNYVKK